MFNTLWFTILYNAGLFASSWSLHFGKNWLNRPTLLSAHVRKSKTVLDSGFLAVDSGS